MAEGLSYVASWMTVDGFQCYQVMDSPSRELHDLWINNWADLVGFEVMTVETSSEFWQRRG